MTVNNFYQADDDLSMKISQQKITYRIRRISDGKWLSGDYWHLYRSEDNNERQNSVRPRVIWQYAHAGDLELPGHWVENAKGGFMSERQLMKILIGIPDSFRKQIEVIAFQIKIKDLGPPENLNELEFKARLRINEQRKSRLP